MDSVKGKIYSSICAEGMEKVTIKTRGEIVDYRQSVISDYDNMSGVTIFMRDGSKLVYLKPVETLDDVSEKIVNLTIDGADKKD